MCRENVEIVRQVYEAAARHDAGAIFALYAPDVEWDVSRSAIRAAMGGGTYRGHEGIRSFFRDWYGAMEDLVEDCLELTEAPDEHVISRAAWRGRGRASGLEVEMCQSILWTVADGSVKKVEWFQSRQEAVAAVGGHHLTRSESPAAASASAGRM